MEKQKKIELWKIKGIQIHPFKALEITDARNKYDKKMRKSYGGYSSFLIGLNMNVKDE